MSKKRALIVGINYPGTSYPLQGCVNDANLIADVLTQHYGFTDATQRRMLTDASATTEAILERLNWLVEGAEAGDVLFFHYSGHGSQMINQDYDTDDNEPDNKDEIICPIDLNWRDKVIRDDDLKAIFDKVPNGVNLTVVLDCCNSGSGLDQDNQYKPLGAAKSLEPANSPNRSRWLPMPDDIANRGRGLDLTPKPRTVQSRDVNNTGLLISGCQSHQTSADAWINNQFMGAATFFLTQSLAKHNYDVPYQTIVEEMNASMVETGFTQRPELNGSADLFGAKFLEPLYVGTGLEVPTTAPVAPVVEEPVDEFEPPIVPEYVAPAKPPKKKSKKWIFIAVGLIAAAAFAGYSFL